MFIFLLILLALAIVFEGVVTTLPLVLICLLCLTIVRRDASIFVVAFLAGLVLDVFVLRPVGGTSIFFLAFVFLLQLYQRKYEIYSYQFVLVASFVGSILYLSIFGYENVWLKALLTSLFACVFFGFIRLAHHNYLSHQTTKLQYKS